jgi:AcrR family transcriptional regulator
MLLAAAADLFRERGYHAVPIDDLGAAVGIKGPGIYRHFPTKQAVLVELFDAVTERLLDGARDIRRGAGSSREHLEALVGFHVDFALQDRSLIAVYMQEERNLPDRDRSRLRGRMRLYTDEWGTVLRELRPELTAPAARVTVLSTVGLINSVSYFNVGMDTTKARDMLIHMATAALVA